jgi:esterase/lipase
MGHSMGGTLCAYLADKFPQCSFDTHLACSRDVLSEISWHRVSFPLIRKLPDPVLEKWIIHKKDFDIQKNLSYDQYSAKSVNQFYLLCKSAREGLDIQVPTRVFMATHDETVQPRSSKWFYNRVSHPNRKLIELNQSPHLVFLGNDNEKIFSEIDDFFKLI